MNYFSYFKISLSEILKKISETKGNLIENIEDSFTVEVPSKKNFGELSTNIAMIFSKQLQMSPRNLAELISKELIKNDSVKDVNIAGPGFINLFLEKSFWYRQLTSFVSSFDTYNYNVDPKRICIEYVSANPTGLLHVGHARGAVLGDAMSSILKEVGHEVDKEYYINDAGEQIKKLVKTISYHKQNPNSDLKKINKEEYYPGDYLVGISSMINEVDNDIYSEVTDLIMEDIKNDLKNLDISHDNYISEKEMASKPSVEKLKKKLLELDLAYLGFQDEPDSSKNQNWKRERKLLFRSSNFGDDKDRALIKSNGELTYFMTDIIYHLNKVERGYDILLNVWGADHSGYVKRLTNATLQLSKKKIKFKIFLTGLVNLYNNEKLLKMSKRSGNYLTLKDVYNEVGSDALRFMMISRDARSTIDFDFKSVQEKNKDNPVFYVQYAYARCKSLLKIFEENLKLSSEKTSFYSHNLKLSEEIDLIKKIANFHNIILQSAEFYEPHRITNYLYDLARMFHNYWGLGKINVKNKIIVNDNEDLTCSRIFLVNIISSVIKKGLKIIKINCPENM
jgi:arginyl-tRNA synthetase